MALIALRNHGLLSHWVVDAVLFCIAVVGAHADTDLDIDLDNDDIDMDDIDDNCAKNVNTDDYYSNKKNKSNKNYNNDVNMNNNKNDNNNNNNNNDNNNNNNSNNNNNNNNNHDNNNDNNKNYNHNNNSNNNNDDNDDNNNYYNDDNNNNNNNNNNNDDDDDGNDNDNNYNSNDDNDTNSCCSMDNSNSIENSDTEYCNNDSSDKKNLGPQITSLKGRISNRNKNNDTKMNTNTNRCTSEAIRSFQFSSCTKTDNKEILSNRKRKFIDFKQGPLQGQGPEKRKVVEKEIIRTVSKEREKNKNEDNQRRKGVSVSVLMQLYDLCEVLDVEDDLISQEKSTQVIFKRRYIHPLCALSCLASSIRTRNSDLNDQAYRNRSNQWEGDDIHFSYTRDNNREGPFDPRRDRKMGPSGCIGECHLKYYAKTTPNEFTTHVLKVNAISSSETFHADFDPKIIRRRQFIEHYK